MKLLLYYLEVIKKALLRIKQTSGINRLMLVAVTIEPLITLPQLNQIIRDKNATGVSITSWAGYALLTLVWFFYAKQQKDKLIMLYSVLSFIFEAAIIVAAIMYGGKWI